MQFSKKYIIGISVFFVICVVILLTIIFNIQNDTATYNEELIKIGEVKNTDNIIEINNEDKQETKNEIKQEELILTAHLKEKSFENGVVGYLTIEKIGLKDEVVKEGVSLDVINYSIGHFSNTSIFNGNIGLASHNGGVENASFFKLLHTLENGDVIIYETKYGKREYRVTKKVIIDSYDWSYLGEEKSNVLTLITCVTGKRNERLCVRADEVKN